LSNAFNASSNLPKFPQAASLPAQAYEYCKLMLTACGVTHEIICDSLRLSFRMMNIPENVDNVLEILPEIVQKLRNIPALIPQK
jgi:hypothetical protein